MYILYKLDHDLYQIHSSHSAFEGTLTGIWTYCVQHLGFKSTELEASIQDMLDKGTNGAHFGVNKTFLYSFERKDKKAG
jgi:hypothetical protein